MKCPVEPPAEIRLGYLTRQLDQLDFREIFPQFGKQLITDCSRRACHGNGKVKDEFLNKSEYVAFPIVREISQFFLGHTGCPALGRA